MSATPLAANAPAAPTGLTATAGNTRVDLSWTAPSGTITGYEVRRGTGSPVVWGAWAATGSTTASYAVTGLTNGTAYSFQVRAVNNTVLGAMSDTVSATPAPPEVSVAIVRGEGLSVTPGGALLLAEDVAGGAIPVQFRVSASPTPATDLTVCVSIAETGVDRVAASAEGAKTVTITGGNATVDYPAISWTDNNVDDRNSLVTMTVVAPSDSSCSQTGYTVSSSASSGSFLIEDNERTSLALSSTDMSMTEEDTSDTAVAAVTLGRRLYAGETLVYGVRLSTTTGARLPDGDASTPEDFTVSVSGTGVTATGLGTASPELTFTGHDDNTVQVATLTFTPTAGTDADGADEAVRVGFGLPGSATNVGGGAAGAGSVDLTIDDSVGLVLSASTLTVAEGGSGTYTVALASQPTAEVTVTVGGVSGDVTVDTDGDTGGNQNTLTFTTGDWNTAQTVTVSADEDGDTENDSATLTHTATGGDYAGVTGDSVEVTVTDDDTPGVATATTDGEATEGSTTDTATFTVVLNTQPSGGVAVAVTAPAGLELSTGSTFASSAQIGFTNSFWSTPQTVTVRATDDSTDSPLGRELSVTYTTSSQDSNYRTFSGTAATVTVVDNDPTTVTLAGSAGDVVEGGTKTFTITLNRGLVNGETLPVPLTFGTGTGTATRGTDYTTACPTTLPTGVTCANLDSGNAMVTFTGPSTGTTADSVTLTLSATTDSTAESGGETVVIGLGTLDASSGTGLGGGASGTDSLADFSITDPDTSVPTVEITGVPDRISGTGDITATFTFSEDVTGFVTDDVTVTGGTKGTFTATSATVYTLAVTPDGGADVVVTVAADSATDGTNTGPASAETATAVWTALVFSSAAVTVVEEASATYTVALSSQPDGNVTVTVGGASGEVTFDTDSTTPGTQTTALTFTTTNWSTAQTVTVLAAADGDTANDTATLTHAAAGGGYGSVTGDVAVTVTDNDTPGLVLDPTSLTVAEGGSGTYTVALATQPSGEVTVTVAGASGDVTVDTDSTANGDQNTLTFTTATWGTARTVTVSAGEDNDTANDSATLTHSASGGGYGSVTGSVAVTVTDDDAAVAAPAKPEGFKAEAGNGQVTLSWTGPGNSDITGWEYWLHGRWMPVPGSGAGTTSHVVAGLSNRVAYTFRVRAVAGSVKGAASDRERATPSAPPLIVSESSLSIDEGAGATYTVALGAAPSGPVQVWISSDNPDVTVSPAALDFTADDWSMAQAVAVKAAPDDDDAADAATLRHTATGGGQEGAGDGVVVAVSVTGDAGAPPSTPADPTPATPSDPPPDTTPEDPTPAAPPVVSVRAGPAVSEGGEALFTVTAEPPPPGPLAVSAEVSGSGGFAAAGELGPRAVALTPSRPSAVVAVATIDDRRDEPDGSVALALRPGPGYAPGAPASASVAVSDDDEPSLIVSEPSLSLEEGAGASYTVALGTEPPGPVAVAVSVSEGAGVSVSPASLAFTADDWNAPRTVMVAALEDDDIADQSGSITHAASGGGYGGVSAEVRVSVADNDEPSLIVSQSSLSIDEGGGASYTVALGAAPAGAVAVSAAVSEGAGVSVSPASLAFTADDWNAPRTVTVAALEDDDIADQSGALVHAASGGGYGGVSAEVRVSVSDNDEPSAAAAAGAWMPRFGRAAAEQILEGVGGRVASLRGRAARRPEDAGNGDGGAGFEAALAGRGLGAYGVLAGGPPGGGPASAPPGGGAGPRGPSVARPFPASGAGGYPGGAGAPLAGPPSPAAGAGARGERPSGGLLRAALAGSSFSAGGRAAGGSSWGLWGRGSLASFEGRAAGGAAVDGDVATGQAGADWSSGLWLFGISASHSRGDGDYSDDAGGGSMESSMTALTPYASMDAGRFSAWGAFSAGSGDMKLMPEGGAAVEAGIDMRMGAAGLRGELMDLGDGLSLSLVSDAMAVRSAAAAAAGLPEAKSRTSRVRAAVEASWSRELADGGRFSARLEGGARLDGGGAEEGLGAEVSAGLSWTALPGGLSFELEGRHLVAHEDGGFSRTGASAHLSWDCGPDGLGPSASLRRRWGITTASGLDQLFAMRRMGQFGAEPGAGGLEAELGWGLALPGGRFLAAPFLLHGAQAGGSMQTLGWRMEPLGADGAAPGLGMALKLTRRTAAAANDEHGILLEARLGF